MIFPSVPVGDVWVQRYEQTQLRAESWIHQYFNYQGIISTRAAYFTMVRAPLGMAGMLITNQL